MEKVRVIIRVEGGNVVAVHAGSFVEVVLVDFDNMRAEGWNEKAREKAWSKAVGDLPEVEVQS